MGCVGCQRACLGKLRRPILAADWGWVDCWWFGNWRPLPDQLIGYLYLPPPGYLGYGLCNLAVCGIQRAIAWIYWLFQADEALDMDWPGRVTLYALSQLFYQPYSHWYGQGYSEVKIWDGTHTPMMQYLTHWGAFLFVIVSWMIYESIDWMATTPASALRKLEPYRGLILTGLSLLVILILVLGVNLYPEGLPQDALPIGLGIHIAWLVLPLAAWAGVLLLRPGLPDSKRMVFSLSGLALYSP